MCAPKAFLLPHSVASTAVSTTHCRRSPIQTSSLRRRVLSRVQAEMPAQGPNLRRHSPIEPSFHLDRPRNWREKGREPIADQTEPRAKTAPVTPSASEDV
jgi:hypothetical protein